MLKKFIAFKFQPGRIAHTAAYLILGAAHVPHASTPWDWATVAAHAALAAGAFFTRDHA